MTSGTTALAQPPAKPLLRGRLHQWSFVASAVSCTVLTCVAAVVAGTAGALSTAVYGLTILGLFGISALYHRRNWTVPRHRVLMRRLDHSMIFVFIAGTYTPVAVLAMDRPTATWVLAVVWGGAAAGVALTLAWPQAPAWVGVPIYVALGWVAVFVLPDLLRGGGVAALVLLLAGGVAYTVGGVVYALRRPDPWPSTFGFHEVFHAATVVAAACHHIAIWMVVLPG